MAEPSGADLAPGLRHGTLIGVHRVIAPGVTHMNRYQVTLVDSPGDQIPFVVTFRTIGNTSLSDAITVHAEAMTRHGVVLVAGIDHEVAQHIAATFADQGIAVVVEASAMTTPMVCRPEASIAYRLNAARVPVAVRTVEA